MAEKVFQDLTEKAPYWTPEKENDMVEGVIRLFKPARNSQSTPIMVLEQKDGARINVNMKTVIKTTLEGVAVEGDTVRITFLGKKQSEKGADYFDYKVELARQ